ncbi:MAG: SMI1/KNR4 family protein [Myxococcota bacterium]
MNVEGATKAVANAYAKNAASWAAGDGQVAADLVELVAAAREGLEASAFSPADPQVEGVRAALVADHGRTGKDVVAASLLPLWVHTQGAAFAFDALLSASTLRRHWHPRRGEKPGSFLVRADAAGGPKGRPHQSWGALRQELALVSDEQHQAALMRASRVWETAPLKLRCALAYAFPTQVEWERACWRDCAAQEAFPAYGLTLLGASDLEVVGRAAAALTPSAMFNDPFEECVYTMVDALGERAVAPLCTLLARTDPDEQGAMVKALCLIESEATAAALVRAAGASKVRKHVEKYALKHPALVLRALLQAHAKVGGAGWGTAVALFSTLEEGNPSTIAEELDRGSGDRAVLRALLAAAHESRLDRQSPSGQTVRAAWARLERWLNENHLQRTTMLAPGTGGDELAALETAIGQPLPNQLTASLLQHDGESDDSVGLFYGYELLSVEGMLRAWRTWQDVVAGSAEHEPPIDPVDGLVAKHWHRGWIPLAGDGGGNFFCVDGDPGPGGKRGQVFFLDHETGPQAIEAPSLAAWLDGFAARLEAGEMHIWRGGALSDEPDPDD